MIARRINLISTSCFCILVLAASAILAVPRIQNDPFEMLKEADRLAWLKNWPKARPFFAQAEQLFAARGDERNTLYARVSRIRGELAQLSIQEVSDQLADLLDQPVVQKDPQLRLRVVTVKGDSDMDLDLGLARRDWSEALEIAKSLGDNQWIARANGELGLIDFQQGDTASAMIKVSGALTSARQSGDVGAQLRYLTLAGNAMAQSGNLEMGLGFLDAALALGVQNPDLSNSVMTLTGKAKVLAALNRTAEANELLEKALAAAQQAGSLGYQAELLAAMALQPSQSGNPAAVLQRLQEALDLAGRANAIRLVAQTSLPVANLYMAAGDLASAEKVSLIGLDNAQKIGDRFYLPRHLSQLANIKSARGRPTEAAALYEQALDVLNGLLIHASSPDNKGWLVGVMDDVYLGYFRLAATKLNDMQRAFNVVEQARGRSLADLIAVQSIIPTKPPAEITQLQKRISTLQLQLLKSQNRNQRKQILDELLITESSIGPIIAATSRAWMQVQLEPISIRGVQNVLRPDELLLEFVLDDPIAYCFVISRETAVLRPLRSGSEIARTVEELLSAIQERKDFAAPARTLYASLLGETPGLSRKTKLIIVPDGVLHRLPAEVLIDASGKKLLETHTVSYVQSSNVLTLLRQRSDTPNRLPLLAVSSSPDGPRQQTASPVQRGVFDFDGVQLPPLPGANDEVKAIAQAFGPRSVVITGDGAKESAIKSQPLARYRVLHFALHGLLSTKFPERSALFFLPDPAVAEDGLLQAREISQLRLDADLVTLSACESGSGKIKGQEGVATLVRPFLIAGAKSVVANLWQADDEFTLALMKEFYRRLAMGTNKATALRDAKLELIRRFGSDVPPLLWAGFILVGDGSKPVA